MKYELTDETTIEDGHQLTRIRALKNIPEYEVYRGDLGGFVESTNNLSQEGSCWIDGDAKVYGDARILDGAWIHRNAIVGGNAIVKDNVIIT